MPSSSSPAAAAATTTVPEINAYKRVEKIYKARYIDLNAQRGASCSDDSGGNKKKRKWRMRLVRAALPDLSNVVDFAASEDDSRIVRKADGVYSINGFDDGFFFLPGYISDPEECYRWIQRSLAVYPNPPNTTNLTRQHGNIENLWSLAMDECNVLKRGDDSGDSGDDGDDGDDGKQLSRDTARNLLSKMTWCTLGYPYDWTNRRYDPDMKSSPPFPRDVAQVAERVAEMCGYTAFRSEAAIVNYYHQDSHMGGHKDDSEYDMSKPIVSVSFGHDAIFLLGGETKDIEPVPMRVRNGDVMVMGGRARHCFHGVARIIEDTLPDFLHEDRCPEQMRPYCRYLAGSRRININVRQVFVDKS